MTRNAVELLDALRVHLADFELPDLYSVNVAASAHAPQVSAQLVAHESPEIAAALLAWADTLAEPAADSWRVPTGDTVHLSVTGRLPGGTGIRIYGGLPFTERGPGGGLAPGDTAPLRLGALRHLADLGEVPA
ncbi:MAG TPA: hypothetical protein VFQ77_02845 [Pseudonocardiaceae bacterium]|jgi:hypothetical protein|nr:hypothetical protein [Pseudonocardiaceae bacterium]